MNEFKNRSSVSKNASLSMYFITLSSLKTHPEARRLVPRLVLGRVDRVDVARLHGLHIELVTLAEVHDLVAQLRDVGGLARDRVGEPLRRPELVGQLPDLLLLIQHLTLLWGGERGARLRLTFARERTQH